MTKSADNIKSILKLNPAYWSTLREDAFAFKRRYQTIIDQSNMFLRGDQFRNEIYDGDFLLKTVSNKLHSIWKAKVAYLENFDTDFKFYPETSDPLNVQSVSDFEGYARGIWDKSNIESVISDTIKQSCSTAMGVTKILWKDNAVYDKEDAKFIYSGNLVTKSVPLTDFFWDPTATTISEASYVFEIIPTTYQKLKQTPQFRKVIDKIFGEIQDEYDLFKSNFEDNLKDPTVPLMDGFYELWQSYFLTAPESILSVVLENQLLALSEIYININGKIHQVFMLGNDKVLYSKILPTDVLPYSLLYEYKYPQEFMGKSSVMLNLDNQKAVDMANLVLNNNIKMQGNNSIIFSRESKIELETATHVFTKPNIAIIVKGDINAAIKYLEPPKFPTEVLQFISEKEAAMESSSGTNNASTGGNTGSLTTSAGVGQLVAQAQSQEISRKIEYKKYLDRLVSIFISHLQKIEQEIEFRTVSTNPELAASTTFKTLKAGSLNNLKMSFKVKLDGSKLDSANDLRKVEMLLQLQAQTGQKLLDDASIFDMLDLDNKDELIAKSQEREMQKQQEMQMAQQVGMMTGQLVAQAVEQASQDPQGAGQQNMQQTIMSAVQQAMGQVMQNQQGGGQTKGGSLSGRSAPQKGTETFSS